MTFKKLTKKHFGQYLVYFLKKYFEITGKTYYHGNDTQLIPLSLDFFRSEKLKM